MAPFSWNPLLYANLYEVQMNMNIMASADVFIPNAKFGGKYVYNFLNNGEMLNT